MKVFFVTTLLAFRNLQRNKRRTILTVAAISFSLVCLLIFGALKDGLHHEMIQTATQFDIGTIQIHPKGHEANLTNLQFIAPLEVVEQSLQAVGIRNFAKRLACQALLLGPLKSGAVKLSGVVFGEEKRVTILHDFLVSGQFPETGNTLLLGKRLAATLGVTINDQVTLLAQDIIGDSVSGSFTVQGIYETGVAVLDQSQIYLPLQSLQNFLHAPRKISEIAISAPLAETSRQAAKLKKSLGSMAKVKVETWEEIVPDVKQLIDLNSVTMNILIIIVFTIVAMGIINTMTTITFERFREFGTMAAMGMTPGGIVGLVSMESFMLGVLASFFGTIAGLVLCLYLSVYGIDLTQFTSANQYFANNHVLTAVLTWSNFLSAQVVTLVVSFLAGLYPAWKASCQEPSEALAHI